LQEVQRGTESLKVIAFNEQNDLERPPDNRFVYRLKQKFPGTLVSVRLKRLKVDESLLRDVKIRDDHGISEN
jgi:hypothetical protein